jgi:hypothetical protein
MAVNFARLPELLGRPNAINPHSRERRLLSGSPDSPVIRSALVEPLTEHQLVLVGDWRFTVC